MESPTHPMTEWLCNIAAIYHSVNSAPSPMFFESFLMLHNKQLIIQRKNLHDSCGIQISIKIQAQMVEVFVRSTHWVASSLSLVSKISAS